MTRAKISIFILAMLFLATALAIPQSAEKAPAPNLVSKSTKAIGYSVGGGATKVDLKGTSLMLQASGEAKIEAKKGITRIDVTVMGLGQPTKMGTEFLTYALWVVSPDGRTSNIGELLINGNGEGKLQATTQLQTFSLIVTAEPYFAVQQPSELVVLENEVREDTKGKIFEVSDYKLMKRSQYQKMGNPLALSPDLKRVPLEMYQARNAVEIAKNRKAEQYAAEIFSKAENSLKLAEEALARKANKKEIVSRARESAQFSEDARSLATQKQEEEQIAREKAEAASRAKAAAEAKAAADAAEAKRKADEQARLQAELSAARESKLKAEAEAAALKAKLDAEKAKTAADAAAARAKAEADAIAARAKAEADTAAAKARAEAAAAAAKAAAEQEALRAKEEAARAEAERARQEAEKAEREKQELRARLLEQFNRILETRDTPRGLVVTMADVLFDTGKYELRPTAREKLARLSGIVLAHPGLLLQVEGHTDSTGSDELNQKLSEQRAESTRAYLIKQGLAESSVTAAGFGKTMPVADNTTAAGRQKNRRVEIIVGGEVIGAKIGK
jgi:outer membrane protein OmpA-like peptidoglycan-associated protein